MTAVDSSPAAATVPPQAASQPAAVGPTALPRDPRERLAALFDPGTLELLPGCAGSGGRPPETPRSWGDPSPQTPLGPPRGEDERSGVVAGVGLVHGAGAVAFASDARVQGGAMGSAGCAAIVEAYA